MLVGRNVVWFPAIELRLAVEALHVVRARRGRLEDKAGICKVMWARKLQQPSAFGGGFGRCFLSASRWATRSGLGRGEGVEARLEGRELAARRIHCDVAARNTVS